MQSASGRERADAPRSSFLMRFSRAALKASPDLRQTLVMVAMLHLESSLLSEVFRICVLFRLSTYPKRPCNTKATFFHGLIGGS